MPRETKHRDGRRGTREGYGRSWIRVLKQLFGAPDYSTYLEHCRSAGHPPMLSEREYVSEFFERKGRTPRCC
jgi:uncharacterized short protein YbdD (DUF466 family)